MTATQERATASDAWDGESLIPLVQWGRDHWSTLAYVETRCVDGGGVIGPKESDHLRCNPRKHRKCVGSISLSMRGPSWSDAYSTRLAAGAVAVGHDDWHCIEDMEGAGILDVLEETDTRPSASFGGTKIVVRLTVEGVRLASALRLHLSNGGGYATFAPEASR